MKDDFDVQISAGDRYSGVRMQQGEVQLDADWNESSGIATRQMAREVMVSFDNTVDLAARADTLVHSAALGSPEGGVFRFDAEAGTLRFGDGVRGEAPAAGTQIESDYRQGAGGIGNAARVPPFPIELAVSGNAGDPSAQLLDVWSAIADKLTAAQVRISGEAYLGTAGGREGDAGGEGDHDPITGLAALLRDVRALTESFTQRLERARTDSPPSGDDD